MMRSILTRTALSLGLGIVGMAGCSDTGREYFGVPLFVRGSEARDVAVSGGVLRLSAARVALGPLYLCATESANTEYCETALAELLSVHAFDALSEEPEALGELDASTGSVRSAFFDYGISWLLTKPRPRADEGAVDGHSATLAFEAIPDAGEPIRVSVALDIAPLGPGDAAVNALRTRRELSPEDTLTLVVDPSAWLARVRLSDLIALDDDGDGEIILDSSAQAYDAILQAMTANAPPRFVWAER